MEMKVISKKVWEGELHTRMNKYYHQIKNFWYKILDGSLRFIIVIFSIIIISEILKSNHDILFYLSVVITIISLIPVMLNITGKIIDNQILFNDYNNINNLYSLLLSKIDINEQVGGIHLKNTNG